LCSCKPFRYPAAQLTSQRKALSLGSKKYPEENAYRRYIQSYSGHCNAYTSATATEYVFAVSASHPSAFHGALDRLAQLLISPLFPASSVDRELHAVDSEHSGECESDFWRLRQLKQELSHHGHPFHKFRTGSFDTLKIQAELNNTVPWDRMIGFFEKYYSANLMKLVVLGSKPLDVLEAWVADIFSQVPNKRLVPMR
jgi:secreted Zn-dependent insulinase-like peptidase